MRILAIDPGDKQSAYCFIDSEGLRPLRFAKECAVEKCEGQIQRLGMRNNNAETAAWTYKIAVDSFKDYFGKKDADQ